MTRPKASFEVPVFPWMLKAETVVVTSPTVADPFAAAMNMGSFRMVFTVSKRLSVITVMRALVPPAVVGRRTVSRYVTASEIMMFPVLAMVPMVAMLRA